MAKGINLALSEFESNITNVINQSNLPICVVRLVLEKLLNEVSRLEDKSIAEEVEAFTKEVDENGNEEIS